MNRVMQNSFCRILIALMVWTPFQMAHAGMIGSEQFVSSAPGTDRTAVLNVLGRPEVAEVVAAAAVAKPKNQRIQFGRPDEGLESRMVEIRPLDLEKRTSEIRNTANQLIFFEVPYMVVFSHVPGV